MTGGSPTRPTWPLTDAKNEEISKDYFFTHIFIKMWSSNTYYRVHVAHKIILFSPDVALEDIWVSDPYSRALGIKVNIHYYLDSSYNWIE